jgi:hypothetical protein
VLDSPRKKLGAPGQKLGSPSQSLAILPPGDCAMTTHARPGYISRNTDGGSLNEPVESKEKDLNSNEHGVNNDYSKTDVEVDIQNGELHHETSDDDFADKNVPVETAADLVTQIIHLEDNPDEASLTFRTWFLGKRDTLMYLSICSVR